MAAAKRQLFSKSDQPLQNWTFYLDLKYYRNTKSLRSKLEQFGGRVEEFLSREVKCVITNSDINGIQPLRRSPRSKAGNGQLNKPLTRAQGILAKAKEKRASGRKKTNVIAIAKGLGIDVKHVDDVSAWLDKKETDSGNVNNEQTRVLRSKADGKSNSRQLKSPFIKIEDQSRLNQPLFKELSEWPKIHFESQSPNCPFEPPSRRQLRSRNGTSSSTKGQQFKHQTAKATGHNGSSQKVGYCEVCKANYRGFKRHLRGILHKRNATNAAAYKDLDKTISQGKTMNEYLEQLRLDQLRDIQVRTAGIGNTDRARAPQIDQTPKKPVTPLKIIFSPRAGYAVVRNEAGRNVQHMAVANEGHHDDLIVTKSPRKRCVDEYSVIWMRELTMKIKRSTRILRESGRDQGSVFVEFPVFKEQQNSCSSFAASRASSEDSAVIKKYGDIQGKLRLSTRILDNENHQGLEVFECPLYVESSEL